MNTTYREFEDWLSHPTTLFFMNWIRTRREGLKEQLANGDLTDNTADATALRHAEAIGQCSVMRDIIDIRPADVGLAEKEEPTKGE